MADIHEAADVRLDDKAEQTHVVDTAGITVYIFLLIITTLTIWTLKNRRNRFLHYTGLAIIYGAFAGLGIHYSNAVYGGVTLTTLKVEPSDGNYNQINPPDILWLTLPKHSSSEKANKTYSYRFKGQSKDINPMERTATFDPEVFFNVLLPPIIFNAGYSMKRRYFFRNLGSIFMFAFVGTAVSAFTTGGIIYVLSLAIPHLKALLSFQECLYFGALISATDPVTVLAIFHDLHVDVMLYALVFGESVLNDAVAIVMTSAVDHYGEQASDVFEVLTFFKAVFEFVYVFFFSFLIGSVMGCVTALITKFTRIRDFPILETCLFVLMSYSTFIMAEAAKLTGIVAVLFCGVCQAHYTYNNLSEESKVWTKQFFLLLNFLAENFIFLNIGVSLTTFPKHHWDIEFICISFTVAIVIGRFMNIYPLSFLLNLKRRERIPMKFQHILFCSGLRGAIAFALAIRNTLHVARQMFLSTTSVIVTVTVIICGGSSTHLLTKLDIPVGVEDEGNMGELLPSPSTDGEEPMTDRTKAWLPRLWSAFDTHYMKPLLTHSTPTLMETLPTCCRRIGRWFTSTTQLSRDSSSSHPNSDAELCIDQNELSYGERSRDSSVQSFQR